MSQNENGSERSPALANATTAGGGCSGECGCGGDRAADSAAAAPILSVDTRLDVREVPHDQRHALVLSTVASLQPGEAVVLIAPHAPRPLLAQINERFHDLVETRWLQSGPDVWQVRLHRVAAPR